jgi:hypothetical protein
MRKSIKRRAADPIVMTSIPETSYRVTAYRRFF